MARRRADPSKPSTSSDSFASRSASPSSPISSSSSEYDDSDEEYKEPKKKRNFHGKTEAKSKNKKSANPPKSNQPKSRSPISETSDLDDSAPTQPTNSNKNDTSWWKTKDEVKLLKREFEENQFPSNTDKMRLMKKTNASLQQIRDWFRNHRNYVIRAAGGNLNKLPRQLKRLFEILEEKNGTPYTRKEVDNWSDELNMEKRVITNFFYRKGLLCGYGIGEAGRKKKRAIFDNYRKNGYYAEYQKKRPDRPLDIHTASHHELFKRVQYPSFEDYEIESKKTHRTVPQIKLWIRNQRREVVRDFVTHPNEELPFQMRILHEEYTKDQNLKQNVLNDLIRTLKIDGRMITFYFFRRRLKDRLAGKKVIDEKDVDKLKYKKELRKPKTDVLESEGDEEETDEMDEPPRKRKAAVTPRQKKRAEIEDENADEMTEGTDTPAQRIRKNGKRGRARISDHHNEGIPDIDYSPPRRAAQHQEIKEELDEMDDGYARRSSSVMTNYVLLSDLSEERVRIHGKEFKDIPLPRNHSLDYVQWNQKQLIEFVDQIVPKEAVEVIKKSNINGGPLFLFKAENVKFYEETFKHLGEGLTFDRFLDIGNMVQRIKQLTEKKRSEAMKLLGSQQRNVNQTSTSTRAYATRSTRSFSRQNYYNDGLFKVPLSPGPQKRESSGPSEYQYSSRTAKEKRLLLALIEHRVKALGEEFRGIPLPYTHSLEYESWDRKEVIDFVDQFLPPEAVDVIRENSINGASLISFSLKKEKTYKELMNPKNALTFDMFAKIGDFIQRIKDLKEKTDFNAMGPPEAPQRSANQPSTSSRTSSVQSGAPVQSTRSSPTSSFSSPGTIEVPLAPAPKKRHFPPLQMEEAIGHPPLDPKDLKQHRLRRYGPEFENIPLPFNYSLKVNEWTSADILEFLCQFLPERYLKIFTEYPPGSQDLLRIAEKTTKKYKRVREMEKMIYDEETFTWGMYEQIGEYVLEIKELEEKYRIQEEKLSRPPSTMSDALPFPSSTDRSRLPRGDRTPVEEEVEEEEQEPFREASVSPDRSISSQLRSQTR